MGKILEGKSALVTGGGGGFGKASARLLVRDGASVVLTGRTLATLEKSREKLLGEFPDGKIAIIAGDATKEADVKAAIAKTVEHGGGLDIVVAVVGGGSGRGMIDEWSLDKLMGDYLANVGSAFLMTQNAVPLMKEGSSIVFISSTAATMSFVGLSSYCAAKAGLDHFMRTAANEYGKKGIRFNSVRPGLTKTDGMEAAFERPGYTDVFMPLIPLGRTGVPNDIAEAVRFLAGPEAAWLTGQTFAVDGGQETRMNPLPVGF